MKKFLKFVEGVAAVGATVCGVLYFAKNVLGLGEDYDDDEFDDDFDDFDELDDDDDEDEEYVTLDFEESEDETVDNTDTTETGTVEDEAEAEEE